MSEPSIWASLKLDPFWQKAVDLDVGVFIHPVQAVPLRRSAKFGLTQIAQYTSDTTMMVGSIIMSGVLDRFPTLRLLLSHGGGGVPYLIGRFDCMHERMDKIGQGNVAKAPPSAYLKRFYYDSRSCTIRRSCAGSRAAFQPAVSCSAATTHSRLLIAIPSPPCDEPGSLQWRNAPSSRKMRWPCFPALHGIGA